MTPKILFAFKNPRTDDPSACHAGMGVTATNAAMALKETRTNADALPVANGEYLWSKLAGDWTDTTHVVLCAPYIDSPFVGKLVRNFPQKRFALIYHSNLGFLSVDRFAASSIPQFLALQSACPNFTIAANSAALANAITKGTGQPMTHLPNLYHLPHMTRRTRPAWINGMPLHLGLFGAARVLKNWLTATVAAMIVQRTLGVKVYLHLSSGRDEGAAGTRETLGALVALNSNVQTVDVPWLLVDDFHRYLYGMDLLLQPSFTETFNNVTADGCNCGVPSVVSEAIGWVPDSWIAKADSAADVARVACAVLRDKHATANGWKSLDQFNRSAIAIWQKWISK